MASDSTAQGTPKIPVTIVTGFLGSGKTTLINYILQEKGSKNVAVVENEFGEVNIDSKLVADTLVEKEDVVSLERGCVCCSLRKDVVKALAEVDRRGRHRGKHVEAVLLETTGLADPAPVAFTFFANPWIASKYRLDSILCVVDARYVLQHVQDVRPAGIVNEAAQQVAFADLLLLNKVDLVTRKELEQVKKCIRNINATASIVETQLNVPEHRPAIDSLLGVNYFSLNRALEVDPEFLDSDSEQSSDEAEPEPEARGANSNALASSLSSQPVLEQMFHKREADSIMQGSRSSDNSAECSYKPSHYTVGAREPKRRRKKLHDDPNVGSVGIMANGPLDEYRFNMYMRDLLNEKGKDIFRCKGVLCIQGYGNIKFVFQGVHETIHYGPADKPWGEDEPKVNKIVFIGKDLDRKALVDGIRTCVWLPLPDGWMETRDTKTGQPYYYNASTKQRTWVRPEFACPLVHSKASLLSQPKGLVPRRRPVPVPHSLAD